MLLSYHGTNRFEHVPIPQGRRCVQGGLLREQLQISEGVLLSMAGICISGTSRQSPCVFADHRSGVKHDQQLRDWHRKPDRIGVDQRRKNHDQNAADDKSPCHRNNERCLRLHDRLEIIGREDVSSLETECAVCRSTSINRKDDSKWLIAIRNNDEFAKLLDPYRYYFVLFEFESIYDSNNNDIIASIWEVDPKSKGFAYCMIDYYLNIRSQSTSKAPFNMWPHMLKFALTEPTLIYRSKITNDGNIITDVFPSKNNTYSDVLLPLSSYSGSTTISVANIKNVIKKYSPSARVNGLNKEKLLQLLEDIRKTNNITNADLCNKFADEIYLPKIVLKKADIPLSLRSQFIDLR